MRNPRGKTEAFSRVVTDAQLKDIGWSIAGSQSVRYEYQLPDSTFADYMLSDRRAGHPRPDATRRELTPYVLIIVSVQCTNDLSPLQLRLVITFL